MQVVGARILVSRLEEEKDTKGFQTATVDDTFTYKGKVEAIGIPLEGADGGFNTFIPMGAWPADPSVTYPSGTISPLSRMPLTLQVGNIVLFAKYSPDTHLIKDGDKEMKIVSLEDVLAVM